MDEAMNMEEQMPVNSADDDAGSSGEPVSESEAGEDLPPPEPETEVAVTDNVTADPVAEDLEADNGYGLRGELSEEANDGYSIVLHSLRQEANAESIAADLDAEGLQGAGDSAHCKRTKCMEGQRGSVRNHCQCPGSCPDTSITL